MFVGETRLEDFAWRTRENVSVRHWDNATNPCWCGLKWSRERFIRLVYRYRKKFSCTNNLDRYRGKKKIHGRESFRDSVVGSDRIRIGSNGTNSAAARNEKTRLTGPSNINPVPLERIIPFLPRIPCCACFIFIRNKHDRQRFAHQLWCGETFSWLKPSISPRDYQQHVCSTSGNERSCSHGPVGLLARVFKRVSSRVFTLISLFYSTRAHERRLFFPVI